MLKPLPSAKQEKHSFQATHNAFLSHTCLYMREEPAAAAAAAAARQTYKRPLFLPPPAAGRGQKRRKSGLKEGKKEGGEQESERETAAESKVAESKRIPGAREKRNRMQWKRATDKQQQPPPPPLLLWNNVNARACFSADRYRFSALLFYNALTDKSRFSAGCHRRVCVYICVFVELCLRKKNIHGWRQKYFRFRWRRRGYCACVRGRGNFFFREDIMVGNLWWDDEVVCSCRW